MIQGGNKGGMIRLTNLQDSDKENQLSVRGARGRGGQLGSTGDSGSQVHSEDVIESHINLVLRR